MASVALTAASLAPGAASSAVLKPGSYNLSGIQDICLEAGGSWYGEDFAAWGGLYELGSNGDTVIFGNYSGGAGNDSILVKRSAGTWTEWQDDLSFSNFLTITVTKTSNTCTPPPTANKRVHNNPAE